MPRSNIKLLTREERQFFNTKYSFELVDDVILVKLEDYGRVTAHNANESFNISSKLRKIKISKEAIRLWRDRFMKSASLIDVQNAMNALTIAYQTVDYEDVKTQLEIIEKNDRTSF